MRRQSRSRGFQAEAPRVVNPGLDQWNEATGVLSRHLGERVDSIPPNARILALASRPENVSGGSGRLISDPDQVAGNRPEGKEHAIVAFDWHGWIGDQTLAQRLNPLS